MKNLLKNCTLPDHLEVLFLLVSGIFLQVTDGNPFAVKERWMIVWETELPAQYFSQIVQKVIKTVLSMIVVIRCSTTYAYVVSAMLVIFCLLKDSAPKLMLLWLLVAGLKSVLLTFVEALTGVYVCSAFGHIRKACIEFVISKAIEIIAFGPVLASYLWGSVLNIYQKMERKAGDKKQPEQLFLHKGGYEHHRARSLLDESTLYKTACLNTFEFKDVPQIILQMLRRGDEMSHDSLLDPGMMLASVSNMGSFDNLKTSQSLGELGFVDLRCAQVVDLEDDDTLSTQDKALKFLKLTWSDVRRAQRNKTTLENDIYRIDKDTWERLVASGTHLNKPKRARAEVFVREIESEYDTRKPRKRSFDLKFSWSFFNLYTGKQSVLPEIGDEQDGESATYREDEDEGEEREDEEPTRLFMSNIKEEVVVNRTPLDFMSKKMKGNAYSQLYKQNFMSVIGSEVFEKATKLKKVTSLSKMHDFTETVTSITQPTLSETVMSSKKKSYLPNDSLDKAYQTSSSELELNDFSPVNIQLQKRKTEFECNEIANNDETDSGEDKNHSESSFYLKSVQMSTQDDENPEKFDPNESSPCNSENSKLSENSENDLPVSSCVSGEYIDDVGKPPRCYKKRKIIIRKIGRPKTEPPSESPSPNSDTCSDSQTHSNPSYLEKNSKSTQTSEKSQSQSRIKSSDLTGGRKFRVQDQNHYMYFLTDFFQKPLMDVFSTYYDLNKKFHKQTVDSTLFGKKDRYGKCKVKSLLHPYESDVEQQRPNWKSGVLKAVEAYRMKNFREQFSNFSKKNCLMTKLVEYYTEKINSLETEKEKLLSLCVAKGFTLSGASNEPVQGLSSSEVNSKANVCKNVSKATSTVFGSTGERETTENQQIGILCKKRSRINLKGSENLQISNVEIVKSDTDFENLKTKEEIILPPENCDNLNSVSTTEVFRIAAEAESVCSQESDEPISLYYSKAANLASPLLDVKRFIYPDHIHYSYKHVKKKGFDVDITGGFPLLVRESLLMSASYEESMSVHPKFTITRRPMDLSFATTNAFAEWQANDQNDIESVLSETKKTKSRPKIETSTNIKVKTPPDSGATKSRKLKMKCLRKSNDQNENQFPTKAESTRTKPYQNRNDFKELYSRKDYILVEKLLKMHLQFNNKKYKEFGKSGSSERTPVQISSTQLHSNKGRINPTYNPAIFLQENKTRNEKKKVETQEERTKDMFARLEREALLQSKNLQRSTGAFRRI